MYNFWGTLLVAFSAPLCQSQGSHFVSEQMSDVGYWTLDNSGVEPLGGLYLVVITPDCLNIT